MMSAEEVVWLVGLLDQAGVRFWVDGGWGVDALLGAQTRDHDDLDIALEYQDLDLFSKTVRREGFVEVFRDGPLNPVFVDPEDRRIDVHLVDTSVEVVVDEKRVYGPRGLAYDVGAFEGWGKILGRPVACCTAEFQVRSHTGYEINAKDVRDVLALGERFGNELPPDYRNLDST